ncbi:hypothetical protein Pcinc_037420 [Petrolisthes cinctipes]|uniref:Uncharacterized protein n=1 Tax=Petrolisthes cinctipes TaxID=88211 RepID=A0AAE1BSJ9_PETCI|nr:hypothetical protein Pcinc_037420 [Petrolisthes cinctipes]
MEESQPKKLVKGTDKERPLTCEDVSIAPWHHLTWPQTIKCGNVCYPVERIEKKQEDREIEEITGEKRGEEEEDDKGEEKDKRKKGE